MAVDNASQIDAIANDKENACSVYSIIYINKCADGKKYHTIPTVQRAAVYGIPEGIHLHHPTGILQSDGSAENQSCP